MASPISALTTYNPAAAKTAAPASTAPTQETFLKLLVAQMKNQDPMNPTDSTQFISQLAQFSELEQVIAIRGDLDTQVAASAPKTQA